MTSFNLTYLSKSLSSKRCHISSNQGLELQHMNPEGDRIQPTTMRWFLGPDLAEEEDKHKFVLW